MAEGSAMPQHDRRLRTDYLQNNKIINIIKEHWGSLMFSGFQKTLNDRMLRARQLLEI